MIIFKYIFYRMFIAYREKNDNPFLRTFMYMTLLVFFIICSLFIYIEEVLNRCQIMSVETTQAILQSYFFWIAVILLVFLSVYLIFFRKGIASYEERFSKCHLLNKRIKIWMLIVLPFLWLFISVFIYVWLFGGEVFGNEVKGVFPD